MITIFGDFRQLSQTNWRILKNKDMIQILQNLAVFCTKTPIFWGKCYGENIF
jgi:hypothetical protein